MATRQLCARCGRGASKHCPHCGLCPGQDAESHRTDCPRYRYPR